MQAFCAHKRGESPHVFWEMGTLKEVDEVMARQMDYYNYERRHSRLGYLLPWEYL